MEIEQKKNINIVLLGKTGHGKSKTGNTILGRRAFDFSNKTESMTEYCQLECKEVDEVIINVVDTPGLMDTKMSNEEILQRIFCAMSLCPEGFNALVYVTSYGGKFTKDEEEVLNLLKQCFGETFSKGFCIVIMTKGDSFELNNEESPNSYSFEDWLNEQEGPKEFITLLNECQKRVVLFYNNGAAYKEKKEKSLQKFFDFVNSTPGRYTSEHFDKCVKQRDAVIRKEKLYNQKLYVQKYLSLLRQDIDNVIQTIDTKDVCRENRSLIETKLDGLRKRAEGLLAEFEKDDKGTGDRERLIKDVNTIQTEVDKIVAMPVRQQKESLTNLDVYVKKIMSNGLEILYKGFVLIATFVIVGAIILLLVSTGSGGPLAAGALVGYMFKKKLS